MLHRDDHINFMLMMLHGLPSSAQIHDPNRLTMAYFTISGLDLLNGLQQVSLFYFLPWFFFSISGLVLCNAFFFKFPEIGPI